MNRETRILHIAEAIPDQRIWSEVFRSALNEVGKLSVISHGGEMPDSKRAAYIRDCDILLTGWNSARVPVEIAENPGDLAYICNITGELARYIPIEVIDSDIPVTNWGDYPARPVAEGALALLLATLKDMHHQIQEIRRDGWRMDMHFHGGSLLGRRVGIYGLGVIGRAFVELIAPFQCDIKVFDPFVNEMPEGCEKVDTLEAVFDHAEIVVLHAGLTEQTRKSVTADLLARLPRNGVLINTARGGIVDQEALFRELESGRLRAGLDVLDPDSLPAGHPARTWENLILTAHRVDQPWPDFNEPPKSLNRMQRICLDNLRRFQNGQPLRFCFDHQRYMLST